MLFADYSSSASTADSDVEMEDEEARPSPPSPPITPVAKVKTIRAHPYTDGPRQRHRRAPSTSSSDSSSSETRGPGPIRRNRRRSQSPPQSSKMAAIAASSVSRPLPRMPIEPPTPPTSSPEPPSSVSGSLWEILDENPVPPFTIENDPDVVAIIKRHKLAFGVYYELARGVSRGAWSWAKVKEALKMKREVVIDPETRRITDWYVDTGKSYGQKRTMQVSGHELLKGTNTNIAWRVNEFMNGRDSRRQHPKLDIWRELDREAKAHAEGLGRELGLMGSYEGFQGNWYGGRIQVIFRVEKPKDQSEYKVLVEPLESRRSNYFSRALGSTRWAQLKIPDDYLLRDIEGIKKFTSQKFSFMGTTYIPFHAKDGNSIYLLDAAARIGDTSSFKAVCEWHNPIAMNFKQPIAKYSTRNTIGFSNSIPVLEFQDEDISFDLDDLTATVGLAPGEEPASHQLMTDGCGFINREALIKMKAVLPGLEFPPSAIQARIAGAKGVWVLHPTDTSDRPRIWIRPSQNKIKLPRPFDRAHRILNLLSTAHPMKPCSLSLQSILNLSHNGVSNEVLAAKLEEGLQEVVRPLMDWTRPHAMLFLYDAVSRIGSVGNSRAARLAQASSRALGLTGRDRAVIEEEAAHGDDDHDLELDSVESNDNLEYTGRNKHSGLPLGLQEGLVEAIQAGFSPQTSEFVYGKLHALVQNCIEMATKDFRLPITQSTTAIMIADPKGVLKENEVFFKPSSPLQNPRTGELLRQLEGDVLIGRYPLRLASDMQKVIAVNKLELQEYLDVLVLPIVGARSLASVLSGGDYDGDEDIIIWDQDIVRPFRNHPFVAEPPDFLAQNFEKQVQRVGEFCDQVYQMDVAAAQRRILDVMLLNVCDSKVGVYSKFHDTAVWKHGLNHERAVLLAYMFTTVLDSPKTGLRVKPEVFKEHKVYDAKTPWAPESTHPLPQFLRKSDRPCSEPFILNHLLEVGKRLGDQLLHNFEIIPKQLDDRNYRNFDRVLLKPYHQALELVEMSKAEGFLKIEKELDSIIAHVDDHRARYSTAFNHEKRDEPTDWSKKKKGKGKAGVRIPKPLENFTRTFAEGLPPTTFLDGPRVAGSYAYHCGAGFAFNVAFRMLCLLKAESQEIAPSTTAFDQARIPSSKYMRIAAEGGED
ncbi:hypothetical protein ONZ45_g18889 [Pleurotus djamor]|nr:hypothetical protein ONZ45_g18889 [Pleurotus djamor]